MSAARLKRLIENARQEMGPDVFREFQNDLSGRRKVMPQRAPEHDCLLCEGSGRRPEFMGGGICRGCDGKGKF